MSSSHDAIANCLPINSQSLSCICMIKFFFFPAEQFVGYISTSCTQFMTKSRKLNFKNLNSKISQFSSVHFLNISFDENFNMCKTLLLLI